MGKAKFYLFSLLLLLLPTQFGRHFWPDWSQIQGIRIDYLSPTLYLTDILIIFLFLLSVPSIFLFLKKRLIKRRLYFLGGAFLVFIFLGITKSKTPTVGFYYLAKLAEFTFLFLYLVKTIKTSKHLQRVTLLLSLGLFFESILALVQFSKQGSIGGFFWWLGERTFTGQTPGIAQAEIKGELFLRPYGTFSHPNVLAGFTVVVLALILGVSYHKGWEKVIKWLAATLGTLALFFTFSRSGWIVGSLVIFYWIFVQKKWLPFLLMILLVFASFGFVGSRFQTLLTTDRESWQRRQDLNMTALSMINSHPLLGVGLGNFLVELPSFYEEKGAVRFFQPAHNVYLIVGAEIGLTGLLIFVTFLLLTLRKLWFNFSAPLLIAFSAILALSFFDHYFYTLQQTQLLFTLILGLSWAKIRER